MVLLTGSAIFVTFFSTVFCQQQLHYDTDCSKQVIPVYGAGSESAFGAYQTVGSAYIGSRISKRTIDFSYVRKNSWYGIKQIIYTNTSQGQSHNMFAASEITFTPEEKQMYRGLIHVPVIAEPLAILFNLPMSDKLNLTLQVLAAIYLGKINRWNHPELRDLNPSITLPNEKILLVVRQDAGSGETFIFTKALTETSAEWKAKYGIFTDPLFVDGKCCNSTKWPDLIAFYGNTANGLTGVISSIPYTIGYASLSNALMSGTVQASIYNQNNHLVKPTILASQSAISSKYMTEFRESDMQKPLSDLDLINANNNDSYPMVTFSFIVLNRTTSPDVSCCSMEELVGLIDLLISMSSEETLTRNNLVPLPSVVSDYVKASILPTVMCKGESVYANYLSSLVILKDRSLAAWQIVVIVLVVTGTVFTVLIIAIIRYTQNKGSYEVLWAINSNEFSKIDNMVGSNTNLSPVIDADAVKVFWTKNSTNVYLTKLNLSHSSRWKKSTKRLVSTFYREFQHQNLAAFLGVTVTNGFAHLVSQYCAKGTLHKCLCSNTFDISIEMKYCLASDIVQALLYLHKKNVAHGLLSSIACYVDTNWTVKVAGWKILTMYYVEDQYQLQNLTAFRSGKATESEENLIKMLYRDPYLSSLSIRTPYHSDVYSFGALLIEIFTQKLPYFYDVTDTFSYTDIINDKFSRANFIPNLSSAASIPEPISMLALMCMKAPNERPSMTTVETTLNHGRVSNKSIIDIAMDTMEKAMTNLMKMTNRMQELLNAMLPPQVATKLFNGEAVDPEFFENATIFFSDIVGFTKISSKSTPYQVMELLNKIWLLFDQAVSRYDVYKVDTIGDAYMVASGLPVRNGNSHVKFITELSLDLMKETENIKVVHLNNENLAMRMGFNSGAVTAGVIGHKMPQYCVFGDAVNTASRMESTSLPYRIQVSESSYELLSTHFPSFELLYRGEIEVKGKGHMKTYWLERSLGKYSAGSSYMCTAQSETVLNSPRNASSGDVVTIT